MQINGINNLNFGAKVIGNLKKEIKDKIKNSEIIEFLPTPIFYDNPMLDCAISQIKRLLPDAKVDIDKDNPSKYIITINKHKRFADRGADKDGLDYSSLIEVLKHFQKDKFSTK